MKYALIIWILNNPPDSNHIIKIYNSKTTCELVAIQIEAQFKDNESTDPELDQRSKIELFCSPLTTL